ncbi:MAG: ATP:cob(I)alamin adenosyltransferase, partial [Opitutaceae bacterium]|nr:ATP:cob(I)alamin adenosyltransferase [Opitutaceae bacterium]
MAEAPLTRSIATRTGDDGTTSLLYGQRVLKNHPQIEAVGVLDELNAALGFAKATRPTGTSGLAIEQIQRELVGLMGELSCAPSDAARYAAATFAKIGEAELANLDAAIAVIEARQPKFDGWATPGANVHAAALDLARTTARRAER